MLKSSRQGPAGKTLIRLSNRRIKQGVALRSWQGFQLTPDGKLLRQIIDLDGQMGIAYERSVGYAKDFHTHDRDLLVFPRGACRMEVRTRRPDDSFSISSSHVLYVPHGLTHDDESLSAVYDTVALLPSSAYMTQLVQENGLDAEDAKRLRQPIKLRRSRWMDDLIERYFFERVLNANSPVGCTFFLEKQILNELARLIFTNKLSTHGGDVAEDDGAVAIQALRFIEARLFEAIEVKDICKAVGTSPATLLRLFKKELGTSPGRYIKERRLDEAALLLERGDFQVSDICMLIGYDDLSAFTRAFKARFRVAPSGYREKT